MGGDMWCSELKFRGGRDDIATEKLKKMSFKIVVGGKLRYQQESGI